MSGFGQANGGSVRGRRCLLEGIIATTLRPSGEDLDALDLAVATLRYRNLVVGTDLESSMCRTLRLFVMFGHGGGTSSLRLFIYKAGRVSCSEVSRWQIEFVSNL